MTPLPPVTVAKAIERKRQGEELVEREQEASLGFADRDSDSGSNLVVPLPSQQNPVHMLPSGCPGGRVSGTNEEVAPGGYINQWGW